MEKKDRKKDREDGKKDGEKKDGGITLPAAGRRYIKKELRGTRALHVIAWYLGVW